MKGMIPQQHASVCKSAAKKLRFQSPDESQYGGRHSGLRHEDEDAAFGAECALTSR